MAYGIWHMAYRKKGIWLLVIGYWLLVNLVGCATMIEGAKGISGISTKILEDKRKEAITKMFNCDYDTCYNKTQEILGHIKAYIYAKDTKKRLVAIYVTEEDTTPVGIFFKEIDANKTQIEVSSPSTYAKEFISEKVFSALEKKLNPKKEQGESDAKKEIRDK